MARIAARNGRLYVGIASGSATAEPVAFISKWTFNAATDTYDVTALGDGNKTYVAGLPDAQGTFNGFFDDGTTQTYAAASDSVARRFYLYPDTPATSDYWFGTAFFDFSAEGDVGGPVTISGSWKAATNVAKVER
jgi:hypothetical protein